MSDSHRRTIIKGLLAAGPGAVLARCATPPKHADLGRLYHRRAQRDAAYHHGRVFDEGRYFDVTVEYAKASPEDICVRITATNRGPDTAILHLLPSRWSRNTWSWEDPDDLKIECPTGSGVLMTLDEVAADLSRRLASIFLPDGSGRRPGHGGDDRYALDPQWRNLVLFHEYFDGDNGRGCGASHQTGWRALVVRCLEDRLQDS